MLNNNGDISGIWAVPGPEVLERSLSVTNLINLLRNILRSYNIYFKVLKEDCLISQIKTLVSLLHVSSSYLAD